MDFAGEVVAAEVNSVIRVVFHLDVEEVFPEVSVFGESVVGQDGMSRM